MLEYEIDYSQYEYTINNLIPDTYNDSQGTDVTILSGGYCVDGDYVHVDIVWQQQGNYLANHAYIEGFPKPTRDTAIYDFMMIMGDEWGGNNIPGKMDTKGHLSMNWDNLYNQPVHWQFTYKMKH